VAAPVATAAPAPIFSRQTLFAIPFRIERPSQTANEPVEVQLYVSGDRGGHWDFYRKTNPERGQILFRAGIEGEYWFSIRTLDRSGKLRPEGPFAPGLKVIVDTTPPKLRLDARRGSAGQIIARLEIEEPYPKADSLSIQYRTGPTAPWQAVAVSRQDLRSAGLVHRAEVAWWPSAGTGTLEVRAEISDMAGNPAVSSAQVAMTEPAPSQAAQPATAAVNSAQVAMAGPPVAAQKIEPQAPAVVARANPPVGSLYPAPPAGRITSCQQGLGSDSDKLTITWETDEGLRLGPRPITLSLSETRGGPWEVIAKDVENSGRTDYVFFRNRMPPQIFLRLEIRDEAGNIGIYEMPEPVSLDRR
jgi:hypothetical protein